MLTRALRTDQRLFVRGHARVGVQHVQRSQGADLQLLAVVRGQLAALVERPLLGLDVFIGVHQPPVNVLNLVDGVENLLAEGGVGDAAVVDRLVNKALVDPDAGSLKQVLGQLGLEVGVVLRAETCGRVGRCR